MKVQGHSIELHSLEHNNELFELPKKTKDDINGTINIMNKMSINSKYFRAPWGHYNIVSIFLLWRNNLKMILWDVMAEDWKKNTTKDIIAGKIINRSKKGDIICLHDGRGSNDAPSRMIEALEIALPVLISKGYIFKTIEEYNG
ncbi:Bifunctional xylanase/deacetylase precursor [compost metagenome]